MTKKTLSAPLRVWALLGARAGDNNQVIALAEALGLPFEVKQLDYNGLRHLGPRLLGSSLRSLSRRSRAAVLGEPPPDLTISAGHHSVPVVQALRRALHRLDPHGHARLVVRGHEQRAAIAHPLAVEHHAVERARDAIPRAARRGSDVDLLHPVDVAAAVARVPVGDRAAVG